ncbi:MAG: hypothetical protein GWN93_21440 [Deltaproteobacteria bacterium]|nr:hypothetical protein [Deltaproteobacteria bacterium]
MDRTSELILSIKRSPFVPIKLYRDLPRTRELLSDQAVFSNAFSLSPLWTQEPAGLGREIQMKNATAGKAVASVVF